MITYNDLFQLGKTLIREPFRRSKHPFFMTNPLQIRIADYLYELPDDRIAQFPLDQRDSSKLLTYRDGEITDDQFTNLGNHLSADSTLVFNDTRVIRARILFEKPTGSKIEIFCLEPLEPARELQRAFSLPSGVVWTCLIGNLSVGNRECWNAKSRQARIR